MNPVTTEEFLQHLRKLNSSSAPGPSKFRYCLLLHAPLQYQLLLKDCVTAALLLRGLPPQMKEALLYPIPKTSGPPEIGNLRPIALLEIGYKLTTGILAARRIASAGTTAPNELIHPLLAGCEKDSSIFDPLLTWNLILEDAQEHNKPLWVCYADVQAAYDSVTTEAKILSFRAAGMHQDEGSRRHTQHIKAFAKGTLYPH